MTSLDLHGHVVADELFSHEPTDGVDAIDLALVVVHVGVVGEGGHYGVGVEGVHRRDVVCDDAGEVGGHVSAPQSRSAIRPAGYGQVLEMAKGTSVLCVGLALRDALAIEVRHLLESSIASERLAEERAGLGDSGARRPGLAEGIEQHEIVTGPVVIELS